MRTTPLFRRSLDALDPRGILVFLVLVAVWIVWDLLPSFDATLVRVATRLAGYVAFGAMLVPYIHIVRRSFRARVGWPMASWLRWHIASSYLAFAFVLLHCHARASSPLTRALLWLTWIVMVSGVVGFYGQKLLYFVLAGLKGEEWEVGFERLGPERLALMRQGSAAADRLRAATAGNVVDTFAAAAVKTLSDEFRFVARGALAWRKRAYLELEENHYQHARLLAAGDAQGLVEELWKFIKQRRLLDREYRLHRLGRLWLLVHGPAAWALLVLMVEHAFVSVWYGGW